MSIDRDRATRVGEEMGWVRAWTEAAQVNAGPCPAAALEALDWIAEHCARAREALQPYSGDTGTLTGQWKVMLCPQCSSPMIGPTRCDVCAEEEGGHVTWLIPPQPVDEHRQCDR
jgi:hypothetical protein